MSAITDVKRPIEGLDVTQLRQEAAERFTKQEAIYAAGKQAGMLTDEQQAEFRRLGEEIDQFEAVLTKKESFGEFSARHQSIADDRRKKYLTPAEQMRHADPQEDRLLDQRGAKRRSPGQQFIDADGYQELLKRGAFHGELPPPEFGITLDQRDIGFLEQRALLQGGSATSGGGFVTPDYQPGFVDIRQRMLTVLDLVTRIPTNSDTISYVREDVFTNAAAFTAEATATTGTSGSKPESALQYSRQTATVKTLAHWIPVTNRMLADAPAIRGVIDSRLLLGLDLTLESQILAGDGTGENLTGVNNVSNILTQALGTDTNIDAIFKAMIKVMVSGLLYPNATVVHPMQYQNIRLTRESQATATQGGYLLGPPGMIGTPTLWGNPLVLSLGQAVGTIDVADWSSQTMNLFDREQAQVRMGFINDQFVRNMQTLLAELRAAFIAWRPTGICKITGANS
jgi:HK97 family phage major capsid protein